MARNCFVILLVVLTGCAAVSPVPFTGPNGRQAYSMRCSGMGRTLEACYQAAGTVCPNGYSVVDSRSGVVGVPTSGGGTMVGPDYRLAVECR